MSEEALAGIRRVFAAFAARDREALESMIAADATWTVPGDVPGVSGDYVGQDRIIELFRVTQRLTDRTYTVELLWALAEEDHAVACYRARGDRLGRTLDIEQLLLIDVADGHWQRIRAVPVDPLAFLAFWAP